MSVAVKNVFISYAVCAFLGGVLEYFAPQKSKTTLRVTVIAVLIFSVASPIAKNIPSAEKLIPDFFENQNTEYDALMHTANLTEKKIYSEMREILINHGVDEYEIYVTVTAEKDENTVYLNEIKIEVGKEFEKETENIINSVPEEYKAVLKVGVKNE